MECPIIIDCILGETDGDHGITSHPNVSLALSDSIPRKQSMMMSLLSAHLQELPEGCPVGHADTAFRADVLMSFPKAFVCDVTLISPFTGN